MKKLLNNLKNWLKGIFTGIYHKPLIDAKEFAEYLATLDHNGDGKLSANEIWEGVKDKIFKK